MDELIGYEVTLSAEQIRKIYGELCAVFVNQPFEEAMNKVRSYVRRYYSCYPFLLQMGILYLNHAFLAADEKAGREVLEEAGRFMDHIISRCRDTSVCEDAISLKAILYLQLGKVEGAISLLENLADPSRISSQNDLMLAEAYWMAGEKENAQSHTQIRIYLHLLNLIVGEILFLVLYEHEPERCEETIHRVKGMIELYQLKELHPNLAAQFYYQAAVVHGKHDRKQEALEELKHFEDCVCSILNSSQGILRADNYFDRLDEWIDRLPLGDMAPRDLEFARLSALRALEHPAFSDIGKLEEFQKICVRITNVGK